MPIFRDVLQIVNLPNQTLPEFRRHGRDLPITARRAPASRVLAATRFVVMLQYVKQKACRK